ncbi:protein CFAP276 isoform X2 [Halyomorpha halys]|uniref:protein CFAP276 isoform X2 n=1 Tax=Halyomorpha halys TaxID=286706 RepID=UPI0034D1ED32
MNKTKMAKFDRNPYPYPMIQFEELWEQPLRLQGYEYDWVHSVSPFERLYNHNTLASIRQNRLCNHPCAPKDALDICLTSVYDHTRDSFLPNSYPYIQPETIGLPSYRLLRNTRYIPAKRPARDMDAEAEAVASTKPKPGTKFFSVRVGGFSEHRSPFSVKLGITSNHSSTSNGGYSRKVDGTFYTS